MVIYPGYRTNQRCCEISSHPNPSLAFEAAGNLVTLFLLSLISHYSAQASSVHEKTSSLPFSSCSLSSRSAELSLHYPALIHDFWPISRLNTPCPLPPAQAFSYNSSHLILKGRQLASLHASLFYFRNTRLHIWQVLVSFLVDKIAMSMVNRSQCPA